MRRSLGDRDMLTAIVGPSAEVVSGSLLRPINIYYSLKGLKNITASYITIRKVFDLLLQLRRILYADIMIVSGVNPWISASIAVLGKILRKKVVMDFHGFAWLEANVTNATRLPTKALLLVSEKISYRLSQYIITASEWLASILAYHFSNRKDVIVIENAVSYVFEKVACKLMENYDSSMLRKYICEKVLHRSDCFDKLLFIAPLLPSVFKSNMLAYEELLKLTPSLNENAIVAVTGVKRTDVFESQGNIIPIGYVNYVNYIALLLSSDGVILPYPSNAICGGIRNKVLEAGFCKKLVISTKIGVMHAKVVPNIHYIAIDDEVALQGLKEETQNIAKNLSNLIKEKYSFATFKKALLKLLTLMVQERKECARKTNITKNARKSDYKDFLCQR